jgi:predicted nucleotidyltransferase
VEQEFNPMELAVRLTDSPTAQERVLGFLLDRAGERFTEREVRAVLGIPKTTTSVALAGLSRRGLVEVERVGTVNRYAAAVADPLVRTLKLARTLASIRELVASLAPASRRSVLFGSAARGEDAASSDIDLLVVTDDPEAARALAAAHPRVQLLAMTPAELMREQASESTLVRETARGIVLWERE